MTLNIKPAGLFLLWILYTPELVAQEFNNRQQSIEMETSLIIGLEDQPLENQFGRISHIRTDSEGNIFVVDSQRELIRAFDREGNYLRNVSRRGSGPGEYSSLRIFDITPEDNFFINDGLNGRYLLISSEGDPVEQYPMNMSNQFIPQDMIWEDNEIIALAPRTVRGSGDLEDALFNVYNRSDFDEQLYEFGSFNELEIDDSFPSGRFYITPGSIVYAESSYLLYAPGIYNGHLYTYHRVNTGEWLSDKILSGVQFDRPAYIGFESVEEAQAQNSPYSRLFGPAGVHVGYLNIKNAGLYRLRDDRIVHFLVTWRADAKVDWSDERRPVFDPNPWDLSVQVFRNGELEQHNQITSLASSFLTTRVVNWKDDDDNFYMIDTSENGAPIVRRFTLNLE